MAEIELNRTAQALHEVMPLHRIDAEAAERILDAARRDVSASENPFATLSYQSLLLTDAVFRAAKRGGPLAVALLYEELPGRLQLTANLREAEQEFERTQAQDPDSLLQATQKGLELLASECDLPISRQLITRVVARSPSALRLEVIDTLGVPRGAGRKFEIEAFLFWRAGRRSLRKCWRFGIALSSLIPDAGPGRPPDLHRQPHPVGGLPPARVPALPQSASDPQ